MMNGEQAPTDAEYPEWKPTDWTPRQRRAALISLISGAFACALTACAFMKWGTGPLALDTFVPIGIILLTLSATLLTSVFWYPYRHAQNRTGDEPSYAYGILILIGLLASITLVVQVIGGILVATVGWDGWRLYSAVSHGLPAAIGGMVMFVLAMMSRYLKWSPTRDPKAPANRLAAPVTGVRLLFRWAVMLVARDSWIMICGVAVFESEISGKVLNNVHVHTLDPIVIFWCGAACFLVAAAIELLPNRPSPDTNP